MDDGAKWFCGCAGAVLALIAGCSVCDGISGCTRRVRERRIEEGRQAAIARTQAEIARTNELERLQANAKEDKLRAFALAEAPELWRISQRLNGEIELQSARIEKLRGAFVEFGKDPESDNDFRSICQMRDEMIQSLKKIREKLEEAYLASKKFEATPNQKEYEALRQKALQDGIQEADRAARRFDEMRMVK